MEMKRVRSAENQALKCFCAMDSMMQRELAPLVNRIKTIKNGWRDYRMLQVVMRKLREKIYDTVPPEQIRTIEANLSTMEFHIGAAQVSRKEDFVYIALADLVTLVRYAKANECFACAKDKQAARKCELRKSLDHWTTHNMEEVDGCAYREASLL